MKKKKKMPLEWVYEEERKIEKERRRKRCAWHDLSLAVGHMNVYLIMKMSLETEFWKLKTPKMCFQFS